MRINWPALVDDVGWKLARRKHGRWVAIARAMAAAGVPCTPDTVRSWRNRGKTPGGDAAIWLVEAARGLGVPLRLRDASPTRDASPESVPCGASEAGCSLP